MKIYNYSPITFELVSEEDATVNPKDINEYLIPSFSTTNKPQKVSDNHISVFDVNQDKWVVEEDYRYTDCWYTEDIPEKNILEGDKAVITEIGPLPSNITLLDPSVVEFPEWKDGEWVESKDKALEYYSTEIDIEVNKRYNLLFEYEGHTYYPDSQGIQSTRLTLESLSESVSGNVVNWKSYDKEEDGVHNIYVPFTKEGFIKFSDFFYSVQSSIWKTGDEIKKMLKDEYLKPPTASVFINMNSIFKKYLERQ